MGNESWNEFRWEAAFKKGDELAHLYFQLFGKYGDYPEGQIVIEQIVNETYPDLTDYIESDFILGDENLSLIDDSTSPSLDLELSENFQVMEGSELCRLLKATALSWCSVHATLLDQKNKAMGLNVLYNLGRSLSIATCTVGDELASVILIAFLKRLLPLLNTSVGLIQQIIENTPELSAILDRFISKLSRIHDVVIELLFDNKSINSSS